MTRLRARHMRGQEESVNPMDGLGNLADAMLVLAVGIMLALIINWQVDIGAASSQVEEETQIPITEEDMQETQAVDREALQPVGTLYYDETTGLYYAATED